MLLFVSFIGAPGSGKTTAATSAFGALKEMGISCEFVPEYARIHIAKRRSDMLVHAERIGIPCLVGDPAALTDEDQHQIFETQRSWEHWTWGSVLTGSAVVISDTSPWNTLLYFGDELQRYEHKRILLQDAKHWGGFRSLYFFPQIPTDKIDLVWDPNRLHGGSLALELQKKISEVVAPHLTLVPLSGPPTFRLATVLTKIDEALRAGK
jgi:hypothetical protein